MKKIFITGTAGFIGYHVTKKFILSNEYEVFSIDSINNYYDVNLKLARLNDLGISQISEHNLIQSNKYKNLYFQKLDISNKSILETIFKKNKFDYIVTLAAQAGVRHSLTHPEDYMSSNILGFFNILELCRLYPIEHLVYASSSSVYGLNKTQPFSEKHSVDHPMSLYAVSKRTNELMAHSYSHLFQIPTTGLRFFSVYGPWGRPDMAMFIFANAILANKPIQLFNHGNMQRDFTYIDDIVESIFRIVEKIPVKNKYEPNEPNLSSANFRVFNIGNNHPVQLLYLVELIEKELGKKANKNLVEMQLGDIPEASANIDELSHTINFTPNTSIESGVKSFINWYKEYFKL